MWPSKCCQLWWSPKHCSPYGRCYKYTSCLSGTAKGFYAVTELYVRVPFIAGLMCQAALELLRNLHVLNMHQAEEGMYCVDTASVSSLFPMSGPFSDAQWQAPRFTTQAGFQPYGVQWETDSLCCWGTQCLLRQKQGTARQMCHTWPLDWMLLLFGLYNTLIYPIWLYLSVD